MSDKSNSLAPLGKAQTGRQRKRGGRETRKMGDPVVGAFASPVMVEPVQVVDLGRGVRSQCAQHTTRNDQSWSPQLALHQPACLWIHALSPRGSILPTFNMHKALKGAQSARAPMASRRLCTHHFARVVVPRPRRGCVGGHFGARLAALGMTTDREMIQL